MDRVVVLGRGGAGKSTLARHVADLVGAPLVELDTLFWCRPDLEPTPRAEWTHVQRRELRSDSRWVADGDLGPYDVLAGRLPAADTVVLLDYSLVRCAWQAARRGRERADFWWWVVSYRYRWRPRVHAAVRTHAPTATVWVLRNPRESSAWLRRLAGLNPAGPRYVAPLPTGEVAMPEDHPSPPLTDEKLSAVLVRGPRPIRVHLADPDPAWPRRFRARADELRRVLGERARLIEHVGSTSVPGLAAKPIIDIVVGIDDPDDEPAYLPDLEAAGYEVRVREPGHRCLRTGEPDEPVNLHCYPPDHAETRKYLVFRDHLRADADDRGLYEQTKRSLTDREWPDVNYYAEAKGPVIAEILERAGWTG